MLRYTIFVENNLSGISVLYSYFVEVNFELFWRLFQKQNKGKNDNNLTFIKGLVDILSRGT